MKFFAEHIPHPRVPAVHVGSCKTEGHDLSATVAQEVELEAVTPSPRAPAVRSDVLEHLVEAPPGLWRTGIIVLSTKLMPGHFPNVRSFMDGIMWKIHAA